MDTSEADPYEQQLRVLFESFDSNNIGSLDHKGLQQLCEQLPLDQNQSSDLINALLCEATTRVSFPQFWDGLLSLLEGERSSSTIQVQCVEKVKDVEILIGREESPEREVSPKLVLGQKKYGRRSRPESSELEFDASSSEPDKNISNEKTMISFSKDGEDVDVDTAFNAKKRRTSENQANYQRDSPSTSLQSLSTSSQGSLSQAEDCLKQAWQRYGKNGFVNRLQLGQVCECIGIEKLSAEAVQQLFEQLDSDRDGKVSLDDFLLLFRSGVPCTPIVPSGHQGSWVLGTNTMSAGASLSLTDFNGTGMASADAIVEMWDSVGVSNPSLLLRDLNLDDPLRSLNVSSVASALEEEVFRQGKTDAESSALPISAGPSIFTSNLLLAALTLRQAEIKWIRSSLEQMSCERDKLRNDLAEANYRASLLAQEIDDHHSKLEKVSQNQFKLLEQKHAEAIRDLTTRFSVEREQLSQQNNRLEQKVTALQQAESKIAAENTSLKEENDSLEQESRNLAEKVAECEEEKLQMGKELQEFGSLQQRLNELQANQEQDRVEHLCEQISKLRSENSSLRDRNDELTVELEVLTTRLSNMRVRRPAASCVDGRLKRRGNSPLDVAPTDESGDEESPRVGKVRRCSQKGDVSLDNVHIEGLQIHPLGTSESGVEADIDVDSSENLSAGCIGKFAGKKLGLESDQWLNLTSESSSLVGSQDDLINLPNCDLRNTPVQNVDVACLLARIEELERALHLQTNNIVGSQDVKHLDLQSLKEIEVDPVYLSEEETPSSSSRALRKASNHNYHESQTQTLDASVCGDTAAADGQAVEQLQQHCRDLETQLDNVKFQIVKILSEKRACSQENCILKKRISDLSNQLPQSRIDLVASPSSSSSSVADASSDVVDSRRNDSSEIDQSNLKKDKAVCTSDDTDEKIVQIVSDSQWQQKLKSLETLHVKEIAALRGQCSDLENSLSMMRDEYERCEDYWAGKLDEERQLAEQEQQITDEKFSELMCKIREYEDLFADDHMRRTGKPTDGRLETIEEQDGLEKQVMELEEELEDARSQAEAKLAYKEHEIQKLKDQLQIVRQRHMPQNVCCADIAVQVSDLETGSWGSDKTFIVKPRTVINEDGPSLLELDGNVTDNVLSSTPSTSSSCCSPDTCSEEDLRDTSPGALRHHPLPHGRQRRMRHHPHYIALNCLNPEDELQAVGLRLREQEQTCARLQRALRAQQQQTQALLQHAWDRHKQEVADLQVVLQCTQEKFDQQGEICRDQMNRLTRTDILVKELYVENAHLLASIQNLEERCLLLLQQQASIVSGENCTSV